MKFNYGRKASLFSEYLIVDLYGNLKKCSDPKELESICAAMTNGHHSFAVYRLSVLVIDGQRVDLL